MTESPLHVLRLQDSTLATYLALAAERDLRHSREARWPTAVTEFDDDLGEVIASWRRIGADYCLIDHADGLVLLNLGHGGVGVFASGRTAVAADGLVDVVREHIPVLEPQGDVVPVDFWVDDTPPNPATRRLTMPEWDAIAANYPEATREAVTRLAELDEPPEGGRLVLWHGPPGTGKTTALRALLRAWRPWARSAYLSDPDAFLADPAYMQRVLLRQVPGDRWNLVVLEDTADLLHARGPYRDGVARLLNLTDGLLGQGLKVLVLATSNEAPKDLDPALLRPGRCAAEVAFPPFNPEEAAEWLDVPDPPRSAMTLADLFAHAEGREPAVRERRPVGFMAP